MKRKYKYVYAARYGNTNYMCAISNVNGRRWQKRFASEIDAAKAVDLQLINMGKQPINGFYTKSI